MVQFFKGREEEIKIDAAGHLVLDSISGDLSQFYEQAYGSVDLGKFLYDDRRFPLTNAIRREVFIRSFKELFEAWSFAGTFESYLLVFRKIFGDNVDVTFTVSGPGKLNIDIVASGIQLNDLIAREIVDNEFVISNIVDHEDNQIVVGTVLGIETESELQKVLFTMVPNGIYTTVSLTIGEE